MPLHAFSDPDVFVTNQAARVSHGAVYAENYVWKSASIGRDRLDIHPSDPAFRPGMYSVGVFTYRPGNNEFTIQAAMVPVEPLIDLENGLEHTITNTAHYKFKLNDPGNTRLEIAIDSLPARLALFASPCAFYPSYQEHHWSVVQPYIGIL